MSFNALQPEREMEKGLDLNWAGHTPLCQRSGITSGSDPTCCVIEIPVAQDLSADVQFVESNLLDFVHA